MRAYQGDRAVYPGYHGEDLERHITLGSFAAGYISRMIVTGAGGRITTEVHLYRDKFCNLPETT